jgi:hypothetical protein
LENLLQSIGSVVTDIPRNEGCLDERIAYLFKALYVDSSFVISQSLDKSSRNLDGRLDM